MKVWKTSLGGDFTHLIYKAISAFFLIWLPKLFWWKWKSKLPMWCCSTWNAFSYFLLWAIIFFCPWFILHIVRIQYFRNAKDDPESLRKKRRYFYFFTKTQESKFDCYVNLRFYTVFRVEVWLYGEWYIYHQYMINLCSNLFQISSKTLQFWYFLKEDN